METDTHYPTGATLVADGVRVLTRTLRQVAEQVRERNRSVARRVFAIAQRSRTAGTRASATIREQSTAKMKILYQGPLRITRAVVRQAAAAVRRVRDRQAAAQLSATLELVRQVVAQTRARVLRGNTHYPGKVVSLFEPHTEIIRKGKLARNKMMGIRKASGILAFKTTTTEWSCNGQTNEQGFSIERGPGYDGPAQSDRHNGAGRHDLHRLQPG